MKVLKFGGTSVGSVESIREIQSIIKPILQKDRLVVVVSAMKGVTDKLVNASKKAATGDEGYKSILIEIEKLHLNTVKALIPIKAQSEILSQVKIYSNQIEDICKGIFYIQELTPKSSDLVTSYGEIISSYLIAEFFKQSFTCELIDSRELIKTDDNYGKGNVDFDSSEASIKFRFKDQPPLTVCPGYIASSPKGDVVTLGRGGSDYTAAILAKLLDADELQIWTDVSGMMTADPRMVSQAHPIAGISYEEAMELSHFGAKVIYPPTIQPVLERNIPIRIKNTFAPNDKGTIISKDENNGKDIKGLSSINNIALINLSGSGMVGVPDFSHRLFEALSKENINVILITQASSEHSICVGIAESDVEKAMQSIEKIFAYELQRHQINCVEVEGGLSIIALVGSKMRNQIGVSGQLFNVLAKNGINIKAISQGSTERNISVVIEEKNLRKSLNSLHESFFLSEVKRMNIFVIGVGNVGSALLGQINQQNEFLLNNYNIHLRVVGIANSKKMYFDQSGIDLDQWKTLLASGQSFTPPKFLTAMKDANLRNSIFIDNTASKQISDLYLEILKGSISIVTPNKLACTESYDHYKQLKRHTKKYKAHFYYESNVGAGLPIINTLNDLIKSGDKVNEIEAVLSGSINFIFNHYNGTISFSEIVRKAKTEGYTEPDPREDLSGADVRRKILLLVRESGYPLEFGEIEHEDFIPKECMEANDTEVFFNKLLDNEDHFKKIFKAAHEQSLKLKFVASYKKGKSQSKLVGVSSDHPFYHLEGKDNIVLLKTDRYVDQPLVIKGAGAGKEVTASGIFADVMRIANANE